MCVEGGVKFRSAGGGNSRSGGPEQVAVHPYLALLPTYHFLTGFFPPLLGKGGGLSR